MSTPTPTMKNPQGHLVPVELVPEVDQVRDELVAEIIASAKELQAAMTAWKNAVRGDVDAFVDLSAEKYGAKLGGVKGNITLRSYDGLQKVQVAIAEHIYFDERLQAAKALVDECIHKWTEGSRVEIKALVEHAFQTDQAGRINTERILSLTKLEIRDPTWRRAMEAIRDSIQVGGTKAYLRLYERPTPEAAYTQIPLTLAAL